jgi:uncharacterized membrane protein
MEMAHHDEGSSMSEPTSPRVFSLRFSGPGVVVALAFFSLSLFASLLPRSGLFQGVVSGITVMIGYGIGVVGEWAWNYLALPKTEGRTRKIVAAVILTIIGFMTLSAMWQHVGWQNDVRSLFGMDSVSPIVWLTILLVTIPVAALILIIARSLRRLFRLLAGWLNKRLPQRLSRLLGGLAVILLVWLFFTGVLENGFFAAANQMFAPRDTATDEGVEQPQSAARSGSPDSLAAWDTLGRKGRSFVATGPTIDELNAYHRNGAQEPVRVYVGLKSADSIEEQAALALEELKRTDAFDREVLIVATTTGTGFLDPNAVDPLEYVYNGDSAIVGVQYSYLPSWISLLADQEVTEETSQVVFDTIHAYWATLPESSRPEFYLYGLSLGSFGVESILTSINIINEPIDGALLSGPPFVNELHSDLVAGRDDGSPASLPIYQNGRTVRFTAEENALDDPTAEWDHTKIIYLQHASDPVVFFSRDLAFGYPDWLLEGQRGPDVSDDMVWFPIVTMWQVALDLPAAGSVPEGYGHLYTKAANTDAWVALTEPDDWTDADSAALKKFLSDD